MALEWGVDDLCDRSVGGSIRKIMLLGLARVQIQFTLTMALQNPPSYRGGSLNSAAWLSMAWVPN